MIWMQCSIRDWTASLICVHIDTIADSFGVDIVTIPTLRRDDDNNFGVCEVGAKLHVSGVNLNWSNLNKPVDECVYQHQH